jgi:peptidoglycan/xylan/chitin deacetylase (PgdA/CDA1 family)
MMDYPVDHQEDASAKAPSVEALNSTVFRHFKKHLQNLLLRCPGFTAVCRLLTAQTVRTLMYHRFIQNATGNPHFVDSATLRRQMAYVARHHSIWRPDDILAARSGSGPAGRCPVVVTVDDGYRDFYEVAYPVFREYSIPAMLFVITGFVDGKLWLWWDQLEEILNRAAAKGNISIEINGLALALELGTSSGQLAAWHVLADHIQFLSERDRGKTLARLATSLNVSIPAIPGPGFAAVTWEQIREMAAGGMLFGAHSVTHPILSRIPADRARREIVGSRDRLAEMVGEIPRWFCYPHGGPADFSTALRLIVAEEGFAGCFVAYQNQRDRGDNYALPRTGAGCDMTSFRWVMCGAEILVLRLRRLLHLPVEPGPAQSTGSG